MNLNYIDENEGNVIDCGHLKNIRDTKMSHGKEVATSCPSEKALRKELIEWCDYDCYYERKYSLLNLKKTKVSGK